MKVLKWLCSIFLVLGLGLMFTGFMMGGYRYIVDVSVSSDLTVYNHCNTKDEIRYITDQIDQNSLVYVSVDEFNDVDVVSILNGLITVVDTDYYEYVKVAGFETYDSKGYSPNRGHGNMHGNMHKNKFTSLSTPVTKVEFLDYNDEDHCDPMTCDNINHSHYYDNDHCDRNTCDNENHSHYYDNDNCDENHEHGGHCGNNGFNRHGRYNRRWA